METSDRANAEAQDRLTRTNPPMDVAIAEQLLLEVKEIMDRFGVKFFLRQGTCLGAVRDNAFIPWDDDLDIGVVLGFNGFTEQSIEPVLAAFRESGYYVLTGRSNNVIYSTALRNNMRIDMLFCWIIDEQIYHWPGIWFPVTLFNPLKEINFIGKTFLVPNPPEEYLQIKYGLNWRIPKQFAYAKDVVDNISTEHVPGFLEKMKRFLTEFVHPGDVVRLMVLDKNGLPIHRANVRIVGLGNFKTNRRGYAKLYLRRDSYHSAIPSIGMSDVGSIYAMVISHGDHEEVLYEEVLAPTRSYVYRPDPAQTEGRIFALSQQ